MAAANAKEFWIRVDFQRRVYRYHVLHEPVDKTVERFTITTKSGKIIFESNRPLIRFKVGLKRWEPKFSLKSEQLTNIYFEELLVSALKHAIHEHQL